MATFPTESNSFVSLSLEKIEGWKLEDAKARLSEVVRLARDHAPQRITVRGGRCCCNGIGKGFC